MTTSFFLTACLRQLLALIIIIFRFLARKLVTDEATLLMTPSRHSFSTIPDSLAVANDNILRILTFNVANYNDHGKWPDRLNSLVSIILSSKPHLIALQEIRFDARQATTAQSYLDMAQQILSRLRARDPSSFDSATLLTAPAMWYSAEPPQWEGLSIISTLPVLSSSVHYLPSSDTTDTNRRILQSETVSLAPLLLPTKASGAQTQNQGRGVSKSEDQTPDLSQAQDQGRSPSQGQTSPEMRGLSQGQSQLPSQRQGSDHTQNQSRSDNADQSPHWISSGADSVRLGWLPPCQTDQSPRPECQPESESESKTSEWEGPASTLPLNSDRPASSPSASPSTNARRVAVSELESESESDSATGEGKISPTVPRLPTEQPASARPASPAIPARQAADSDSESKARYVSRPQGDFPRSGSDRNEVDGASTRCRRRAARSELRSESESESSAKAETRRQTAGWKAADAASALRRLRKADLVSSHDAGPLAPQSGSPREREPQSESESESEPQGPGGGRSSLSSWVVLSDADDDNDECLSLNDPINAHHHASLPPAPSTPVPGLISGSYSDSVLGPSGPGPVPAPVSEPFEPPLPLNVSRFATFFPMHVRPHPSDLGVEPGSESESELEPQPSPRPCISTSAGLGFPRNPSVSSLVTVGVGSVCSASSGLWGCSLETERSWVLVSSESERVKSCASCVDVAHDDAMGRGALWDDDGNAGPCDVGVVIGTPTPTQFHSTLPCAVGSCSRHVVDDIPAHIPRGNQDLIASSATHRHFADLPGSACNATLGPGTQRDVTRSLNSNCDEDVNGLSSRNCGSEGTQHVGHVDGALHRSDSDSDTREGGGANLDVVNAPTQQDEEHGDSSSVQATQRDVADVQVWQCDESANRNTLGTQSGSVDADRQPHAHCNVQCARRQDVTAGFQHVSGHPRSERDVTAGFQHVSGHPRSDCDVTAGFQHVSGHPRSERNIRAGPTAVRDVSRGVADTTDRASDSDSDCEPGTDTTGDVIRWDDLDRAAPGATKPCSCEPHFAAISSDVTPAKGRSFGPAERACDVTALHRNFDPVTGPCLEPPDDVTLVLANAHFSYSEPLRLEQVSASLRHLSSLRSSSSPRPIATVLVGDFNAVPTESCIELIRRGGYVDAWEWLKEGSGWQGGGTFPASKPVFRIDYVFVDEGSAPRLADLQVVPGRDWIGTLPSDHRGVLVQLDLTAAGAILRTGASG